MAEAEHDFGGPLDLSGADTSGFPALEAGPKNCTIFDLEWTQTQGGPNSKMPAGTPMLKVQFKIKDGEPDANRRLFTNYLLPADSYEHAAKIKGIFVNFLKGLGFDEKQVKSGKFKLDLEELKGKECVVIVSKEIDKYRTEEAGETVWTNLVKSVKPAGSSAAAPSGGLL